MHIDDKFNKMNEAETQSNSHADLFTCVRRLL